MGRLGRRLGSSLLNEWYGGANTTIDPPKCEVEVVAHLPTDIAPSPGALRDIKAAASAAAVRKRVGAALLPRFT